MNKGNNIFQVFNRIEVITPVCNVIIFEDFSKNLWRSAVTYWVSNESYFEDFIHLALINWKNIGNIEKPIIAKTTVSKCACTQAFFPKE